MTREIWFWERMASPHMAGLLTAIAARNVKVVYLFQDAIDEERARQGWTFPAMPGVNAEPISSRAHVSSFVASASEDSIHVCDGLRGNPMVQCAQEALWARGLPQWLTMETVDDAGPVGLIRRVEYRRLFRQRRDRLQGVLAIGARTTDWVVSRGVHRNRVFPFAYFLREPQSAKAVRLAPTEGVRIAFVGQFIELKRVGLLIRALHALMHRNFVLTLIGSGPEEGPLRRLANDQLPGRVEWVGRLPIEEISSAMAQMDCLVLPSRHDGWGAVVSEAMMAGTPVICSDRCGSAGVVQASGHGEVFHSGNIDELTSALGRAIQRGRVTREQRHELAEWAKCLGADAGADYFLRILDFADGVGVAPQPPWVRAVLDAERHIRPAREAGVG